MSNADMLRTVSSIDNNYAGNKRISQISNCGGHRMYWHWGLPTLFYRVIRKIACIVFIKLDCFIFNFSLSCVFKQSGIKDP